MTSLPSWAERLLRFVCPGKLYEQIEGDLIEMYNYEVKALGKRRARLSFILKGIRFMRPGIILRNKYKISNYPIFNSYRYDPS